MLLGLDCLLGRDLWEETAVSDAIHENVLVEFAGYVGISAELLDALESMKV